MEKHVTSLELSKQLSEAGISQVSEYWWIEQGGTGEAGKGIYELWHHSLTANRKGFAAFFASEIGALLPEFFYDKPESSHRHQWELKISRCDDTWDITYDLWDCSGGIMDSMGTNGTLPDAMAQMLLLLIEKKIVDVKKLYEKREESVSTQPAAVEK